MYAGLDIRYRALMHEKAMLEAVKAMIASLRENGINCIKANVDNDNSASIRLLNKLKFSLAETNNSEQIFTLNL